MPYEDNGSVMLSPLIKLTNKTFIKFNGGLLISLISVLAFSQVSAEAIWLLGSSTPPRNSDPLINYKSAPCRDFSRTKRIKIFKPGDPLVAQWSETRDHFGIFRFNLLRVNSATGNDDFVVKIFSDVIDDLNGVITGTNFHTYQRNFVLPTRLANNTSIPTGDYVLQLIHQAKKSSGPIDSTNPIFNFYSCSDIRLENVNANDVVSPDNVSNYNLTRLANSIKLSWVNPISNGIVTENLAYRILVLKDTSPITITSAQLAKTELSLDMAVQGSTAVVAYVGNGELVTVLNTNTVDYNFKIFSYDVNGNYSSGISLSGSQVVFSVQQDIITDGSLLKVNNGNIVVTALVSSDNANENFTYDWAQLDQALVDVDGVANDATFVIDSAILVAGNYSLQLKVKSSITGLVSTVTKNLTLSVKQVPQTSTEPAVAKEVDLGGCSFVGKGGRFDPLLLLMFLISILVVGKRRLF